MALGAIVVVAISILAAVTFLPAVMRAMGRRAYMRGRPAMVVSADRAQPALAHAPARLDRPGGSARRLLAALDRQRHAPARLSALASAGVLLVLAIPALSLEFGDGALRQFPEGNETRVGAELAAKELGPGASGPTQLVATFDDGTASDARNRGALRAGASDVTRRPRGGAGRPPAALARTGARR